MKARTSFLALVALLALAGTATAQDSARPASQAPGFEPAGPGKFKLMLSGAFGVTSLDFTGIRTFKEFAEDGQIAADYTDDAGPGFEAGLSYRLGRHFAVAASFGLLTRDGAADFQAALPHPLYLDKDRKVDSSIDGLSYQELAGHLDLVLTGRSGRFDFAAFAGPSFFKVKSDLIEPLQYTHEYPFDTVTVTAVPTASVDDTAFGFNVGASADYRLSDHFGLGTQVRFSRAKAELVPAGGGGAVEVDAGGLQVAAGIRVYF